MIEELNFMKRIWGKLTKRREADVKGIDIDKFLRDAEALNERDKVEELQTLRKSLSKLVPLEYHHTIQMCEDEDLLTDIDYNLRFRMLPLTSFEKISVRRDFVRHLQVQRAKDEIDLIKYLIAYFNVYQ